MELCFAALAVQAAWEDLIRDANRIARPLALDRKSLEMFSTSSLPTSVGLKHLQLLATGIAEWSKSANRILDHVAAVGESSVEVEGLYELRGHVEAAKKINMTPSLECLPGTGPRLGARHLLHFFDDPDRLAPSFPRIVELGNLVVPLLLTEIGSHPSHLVIALRRITGVDPVPLEDRGEVPRDGRSVGEMGRSASTRLTTRDEPARLSTPGVRWRCGNTPSIGCLQLYRLGRSVERMPAGGGREKSPSIGRPCSPVRKRSKRSREHSVDSDMNCVYRVSSRVAGIRIALYCLDGRPTHAARQLPDGKWTSKLGNGPVVTHNTPHGVEGRSMEALSATCDDQSAVRSLRDRLRNHVL